VQGITGFASHPDVLDQAGARDADMVIAATHSDEVNMVTCQVAHSVFAVPRKIARLRSQAYLNAIYSDLYRRDHLPIDVVISPEKEVAEAAMRRLLAPSAFDAQLFMDDKTQMLGLSLTDSCSVLNTPLAQLSELFPTLRALIVAIRREGKLFVTNPDDQLFVGDEIYLFTAAEDMERTLEIFGKQNESASRFIIVGGGYVGRAIAQRLEDWPGRVRSKVIEKNRIVAETAADMLERTVVLNGDGLDMELLEEANIEKADAFLAVTNDDKTNLLSCARAKSLGVNLAITLLNEPSLSNLIGPLGIDAYINPRATTVSSILQHIRHGRIRSVYSIGDAEAEIIEAQVLGTSPAAGVKISDIDWPKGVMVGALLKAGKVVKPTGATVLEEGDMVCVFSMQADVAAVEKLFQVTIDFF